MLIHRIAKIQKLPTGVAIGRTDITKGRRKGSRKEGGRKEGRKGDTELDKTIC